VVRFIAAISLISYAFYRFPPKNFPLAKAFNWPLIASFWKLSLPHSMAIFLEVTAFGITAPMLAHISALEAAAHNLALLLASTSFMIPMAIANATSVKIAHRMGQGNTQGVINLARSGLILTTSFMVFSALCYWLLGNSVTSLITNDPELRAKMIPILVVMGIFQIADGIQVTQSGIQRGMGHTRKAFLISVFAYWMIAIPIGLYFAFRQNMGAFGMWIGLAIALYIAASLLTLLTRHYLKNLNQKEMLPRINWKEKVSV
jgi:MATE family multidrug resistance protein